MAELVDAHVSGACVARRAGSSPVLGTLKADNRYDCPLFFVYAYRKSSKIVE